MEKMIDKNLSAHALANNWPECYSSPQDAAEPLPDGTVDPCQADGENWVRVWCEDGTARRCP